LPGVEIGGSLGRCSVYSPPSAPLFAPRREDTAPRHLVFDRDTIFSAAVVAFGHADTGATERYTYVAPDVVAGLVEARWARLVMGFPR